MNTIAKFLVLLVVVGLAVFFLSISAQSGDGLPYYAKGNARVKEAYVFASDNPSALDGVKCYCGCMQHVHSGRLHRRGLLDCFKKEDGSFEIHASQCDMCINDALEVKALASQGASKEDVKKAIDSKYVRS